MADDDFLTDEDKALFREHMRGVKRLAKPVPKQIEKKPVPPPSVRIQSKKHTPKPACKKQEYYLSDMIIDTVQSEATLSYAHSNLPGQRFKELKKGQITWEARLDLHGLKSDNARDSLCHFIQTQIEQRKRCVLIIHGKGGYLGAPPVIKNLLNRWLPQFDEVLGFHSALPKDGGNGAVYVLLKRTKD